MSIRKFFCQELGNIQISWKLYFRSHDEDDDAEMDLGGERTERTERSTETD